MALIPQSIISYFEILKEERVSALQRGMNYCLRPSYSVILMSVRKGAPYADRFEDEGKTLIYEGHDQPQKRDGADSKSRDQIGRLPSGKFTQNGLFFQAAEHHKSGGRKPEVVKVYEKVKAGIWVFNGFFDLVDAWQEKINGRKIFKFKLLLRGAGPIGIPQERQPDLEHNRIIPSEVKQEVWKRDRGMCVQCQSKDNLHFDHVLPFGKGGTSLLAQNIQLLCARHNLSKSDRIE